MAKLNVNFIDELFKLLFLKKPLLQACKEYLKYEYIPKELPEYKIILKSILTQYSMTDKLPSIGVVSQQHIDHSKVQDALESIKESNVVDVEIILSQLETYIKTVKFELLVEEVTELYRDGKQEEAIRLNSEKSKEILEISLRKTAGNFLRVFNDFDSQQQERRIDSLDEKETKVSFGIDPIDELTYGGMDVGEMALWIMPSGIGKSTALKWTGLQAVLSGFDVLHVQLEGTRDAAFDKYTQAWTSQSFLDIKRGSIPKEFHSSIEKTINQMKSMSKDIYLYSFEKFGDVTMNEVRDLVVEYEKINGKFPDLIIIDSLDLLYPGDGNKYGIDMQSVKQRMQRTAQLMSNLCVQFKTRILTATQTGDVPQVNDIDFVITRTNTEGDRTLVKPFSYVMSFNQTFQEKKLKRGRIFVDKLRYSDPKDMIFDIATSYEKGRFYDRKRTLTLEKIQVEKKQRSGKLNKATEI
jgi:KaiC/GvpD/RAD55 family RecA-like ATPase